MAAKKKEIEFLEQEYNSLYMEYGKFEKEKSSYSYEVKRYNDLIKPAEERVSRYTDSWLIASSCLNSLGMLNSLLRLVKVKLSQAAVAAAAVRMRRSR